MKTIRDGNGWVGHDDDDPMEATMSRRQPGRFAKQLQDPAEADARKPGQPHIPKFKAGKKRDASARPAKKK